MLYYLSITGVTIHSVLETWSCGNTVHITLPINSFTRVLTYLGVTAPVKETAPRALGSQGTSGPKATVGTLP